MELLKDLRNINAEIDNYCSDLYVLNTQKNMDVIKKYPEHKKNMGRFTCEVTGRAMLEIPFAFTDYTKKSKY